MGLALIAEPPRGLKSSSVCFVSGDGLLAILWRPDGTGGLLNYYSTQILSGFAHFLFRIGKKDTAACVFCGHIDDTVLHTIADCPHWNDERSSFRNDTNISGSTRISLELIV